MPTALVTGASGFTGRYMVDALLERGFQVVGLVSQPTTAPQLIKCGLTDPSAIQKIVQDKKCSQIGLFTLRHCRL